jgi:hypothetical protein
LNKPGGGTGSISAARDEQWNEALEAAAEKIDAYVDYRDGDIFISQSRDRDKLDELDESA